MALAITLPLDAQAATKIEDLWHALADAGIACDALDLGYKPHITLAIMEAGPPGGALPGGMRGLAPIAVSLCGLGIFAGNPACCYVSVTPSAALLAAQRTALASLAPLDVHPHYRAASWMPHITLTTTLADAAETARAIAVLHARFGALAASLDCIELVRFPPVEILASAALG